jgi:antitoxin component of MazEF toxin-antitoxin module
MPDEPRKEGDSVSPDLDSAGHMAPRSARGRYHLDELIAQITPENCHAETGWGVAQGEESW